MRPHRLPAVLALLLMALQVSMDLLRPRFVQSLIDIGVANKDQAFVLHTGLLMVGVAPIGAVGGVGYTLFSTIAGLNFGTEVRERLFAKPQELSFGDLDRLKPGGLITRLTSDVEQVQEAACSCASSCALPF